MSYATEIAKPQSKKLTTVEIDAPITGLKWINEDSGLWFTRLTPGSNTFVDDNGNEAYWEGGNEEYYNIQSLSVAGELYTEVASLALLSSTNKSWYYNSSTTDFYIHLDGYEPPSTFAFISPGAAIGFSYGSNTETNNYYEDIFYPDLVLSVPNLRKSKDPLSSGILEYQGGQIEFDNTSGDFDNFATRDLYGQPVRIAVGFEGLAFANFETLYTGVVEDFSHGTTFTLQVADLRKFLSRKLPVNALDLTTYPNMDDRLVGTPIPIAFGDVIKAPAYRTSRGNFIFCDTTYNSVTAGITVYRSDGEEADHGGTETDGTFTITEGTAILAKTDATGYAAGVSTVTLASTGTGSILAGDVIKIGSDNTVYTVTTGDADVSNGGSIVFTPALVKAIPASQTNIRLIEFNYTVSFNVSVENGLDIIADVLENYEGKTYNVNNYDTTEWAAVKSSIADSGIWIGKGSLMTTTEIIEQICVDNNGLFEVLSDGRYTFRLFDADRASSAEIEQYELLTDAKADYEADEYLSSVRVEYSKDLKEKESLIFTDSTEEEEIYGRYRRYREQVFKTKLTAEADANTLSTRVLERANFIYPKITFITKMQYSDLRVLDNITFTYARQNGTEIIESSLWEVLSVGLNLTDYEVEIEARKIGSA